MRSDTPILVTGGAGFVGSHFAAAASEAGARIVILDDLSGAPMPELPPGAEFVKGDVGDVSLVRDILARYSIDAVVHFAGLIQVGESVAEPANYFETNLVKSLRLLDAMRAHGASRFVFSSTAGLYAADAPQPLTEASPIAPESPYGASKYAVELALRSYGTAYGLRWAALRYFNAAGAHPQGTLRENHEPETHLLPLAIDAATGNRPPLRIFGTDYPTPDGTCIRDYVHVCDLARAHLAALDALAKGTTLGAINLGMGRGYSVREVLATCERVLQKPVPFTYAARRAGDVPVLVADISRARDLLGWSPRCTGLDEIVGDAARSRVS